jgi:dTDP-4-amino-4,6-dideoxygalactose transaminase
VTILQSDPKAGYTEQQAELDGAVQRVLASGWYILGRETSAFEQEFARFLGAEHCVGVASGTDALVVALRACGVRPGDRVFTVSHTAVPTVAAIELAGAIPVLVDVDPRSFTMSPASLEAAIQECQRSRPAGAAKAVIAVHLYGHAANLTAIQTVSQQYGLVLIEDCAQCHGATWDGQMTGTWGRAAAFSFYPTKNLGALGDGGAVVTRDPAVAEQARLLREYGWRDRYLSEFAGMNSRLDEMQSAILRVKLQRLAAHNEARRALAHLYDRLLKGIDLELPAVAARAGHVYHQYVVRHARRDSLRAYLKEQGIGSLVHYPMPVHLQRAYQGRVQIAPGGLPESEAAARTVLSLPLYPQLPADQAGQVAEAVIRWAASAAAR